MAYGDIDNQVQAYESEGLAALQQMQKSNPKLLAGIAVENLMRELESRDRENKMGAGPAGASVIDKKLGLGGPAPLSVQQAITAASPGLEMQGQRMQAQRMQAQARNGAPQPGGLGSLPPSGQRRAGGEIIGYAGGGGVEEKPTPGAMPQNVLSSDQIKQDAAMYQQLKAGLAAAKTPEGKAKVQMQLDALIRDMGNEHGKVMQYIDSTKGFVHPRSQMAGGGIVSLQQGGEIKKYQEGLSVEGDTLVDGDMTETGEVIVARVGPDQVPVTEEEYVAFMETGQVPANRNDRRYSTPTPATPLTAEQIWLKRMDQMDRKIGPIIGGETGLNADINAVRNNPDFSWQEKVGGSYESGAEALGKLIGKTSGTAGITGEYLLRSLGLGASGAGQTGVVGEGVEAAREYVENRELLQTEAAFNEQMAALAAKLNELQNTALDIDLDPGGEKRAAAMAAIRGEMDQLQGQYETNLSRLQDEAKNYFNPQRILDAMQNYRDDPSSTRVGRFLGDQKAIYDEQKARPAEEARVAGINEELAPRSPEERFNQLFRQPEDVAGAGQGQTSDQRQTQRIADAKTQFAIDNPEKKGIADLMQSDKAAGILDIIRQLGYAGGASKGYEGQALSKGMQAERDAETKAMRDKDMLNTELDARMSLMREERDIQARAAQGMGLAEYAATLDDNYIMSTTKYRDMKEKLERDAGKGAADFSWYSRADKEGVERQLAVYAAQLKREMVAAYKAQLEAFNPTANQSPAVAPVVSSEGWGQVEVTP